MGRQSKALLDADFYGILDTGYVDRNNLKSKCSQLIQSGTKIIQLRAKKQDSFERRQMAIELLPLFSIDNAPFFVINDDVELAASLNLGVHIGQDDMSPYEARKLIGNDKVLGLSTHSIEQAIAADKLVDVLDYFAVGPVFATNTKPGRAAVGLELVSEVKKISPSLPWFAIGGINAKTAKEVRQAGAERIVAVSDVLIQNDTTIAVNDLRKIFLAKSY